MRRTAFLFSGQGSQHFQMGRALFERVPEFRRWMQQLDQIVQALAEQSVVEVLYDDRNGLSTTFDQLALTHPAIFMVEYSLARALIADGIEPDLTVGASLGSFAAAAVAGHVDPEQALAAVVQQAAALQTCCDPGAMIAVLADPGEFEAAGLAEHAELAAVNFDAHFVVASPAERLPAVEALLKSRRVAFQRLPVGFAFHSRWIDDAHAPFASFLQSISASANALPLVCCDRTVALDRLPETFFWDVVRRPIRFSAAVRSLERDPSIDYIDVSPGGTLATFLRYLLPPGRRGSLHAVMNPLGDDCARYAALVAQRRGLRRADPVERSAAVPN